MVAAAWSDSSPSAEGRVRPRSRGSSLAVGCTTLHARGRTRPVERYAHQRCRSGQAHGRARPVERCAPDAAAATGPGPESSPPSLSCQTGDASRKTDRAERHPPHRRYRPERAQSGPPRGPRRPIGHRRLRRRRPQATHPRRPRDRRRRPRPAARRRPRRRHGSRPRRRRRRGHDRRAGALVHRPRRHLPPPQIENIALAPGARAPAERERTARLDVATGRGCTVRGEVWAEATDGHGNQAVTRHAGFRYAP